MTTLGSGRVKCNTEDKVMWRVVLEIFVGMGELATGRVVDEFLNGGGERVFRVVRLHRRRKKNVNGIVQTESE